MTAHPSVDQIFAGTEDARAHLGVCASCRAIAGWAAPASRGGANGSELPLVDRAFYTDFEELPGGRGGMGRLFRAKDTRLGRVVAIKQLHEASPRDRGDLRDELRQRFAREARLTARLEHPAIVGVHEAGRWLDGEPFYAMRFVEGVPLEEEIGKRTTVAARITLLANLTVVADALAYAHERAIVHRDVKPRNVLVGRFGETVLIDWGLAKDIADALADVPPGARLDGSPASGAGLTELGVGTPHYMPPEQARGAPADRTMDVYALGATIYHALSGETPYGRDDSLVVRGKLLAGPPAPLSQIAPGVPAELQAIVAKAMDRDPRARFPTARELAEELHRYQNGQLLRTHQYSARELVRHWTRKNRTPIRIAVVAAIALVAFAAFSFARIVREKDLTAASERAERAALQRAQGVTASRLAVSADTRIDALALSVGAVFPAFAAGDAPQREAVQGLFDALVAGPARATLGTDHERIAQLDVSPDFTRVAVGTDGHVVVWDLPAGREVERRALSHIPHVLAFSRAGDRLVACGASPGAETWTLGEGRATTLPSVAFMVGCGFLPDGRVVTAAEDVIVWNAGRPVQRLALESNAATFDVAVDGRVAVGTVAGETIVWNPATNAVARATAHAVDVGALAFAPDGSVLVSAARDGRLVTYEPDPAGKVTRVVDDPMRVFSAILVVSPHGRFASVLGDFTYGNATLLVFDRTRNAVVFDGEGMGPQFTRDESRMAYIAGGDLRLADTTTWKTLLRVEAPSTPRTFLSPDATRAVLTDFVTSRAHVWDLRTGVASGRLLGDSNEIVGAWLCPGRDRYLTASFDGTARTWDAKTGEARAVIDAGAPLVGAAWFPDGESILVAGTDGVVRAYEADGAPRATFHAGAPIVFATIAPDGRAVATCAADGSIETWDAASGARRAEMDGATAAITAAFSADGKRLIAGSGDGTIRAWDAATGRIVTTSKALDPDRNGVSSVFFTPDGTGVVVGIASGRSVLLDAVTLAVTRELDGRAASSWSSPFDRAGTRMVFVRPGGALVVHALDGVAPARVLDGHASLALQAAFSDDGARIVSTDAAGAAIVWDANDGALLHALSPGSLGEATALAIAPDHRFALVGYGSGALRLHPITIDTAFESACAALEHLGRADTKRYCDVADDAARKLRASIHDR